MNVFLQRFQQFNQREELIAKGDRLLVAVSGGLDSTVLATFLARNGYSIAIAHVNFQLRGRDSDQDARFVENLALTLEAKFHGASIDLPNYKVRGESTQMAARRFRYDYFEKLLDEYNYDKLVVAHHLDDQLETMLLNLVRGTGLKGLSGMLPKNGNTIRPLLSHSRKDIEEFATRNQIVWREDRSNASDDYLRNRIRHQLSPLIKELGMTESSYRNTAKHLLSARYIYRSKVEDLLADARSKVGVPFDIDLSVILAQDEAETYLYEALVELGVTEDQVSQLLSATGPLTLRSEGYEVMRMGQSLSVRRYSDLVALPVLSVDALPYTFNSFGKEYSLKVVPRPTVLDKGGSQYLSTKCLAGLSGENPPGLYLRPRKNGDRMVMLGMEGKSKKIQDLFVDLKVPKYDRDGIYLLFDWADNLLAIPGIAISETAKVGVEDELVVQIETSSEEVQT